MVHDRKNTGAGPAVNARVTKLTATGNPGPGSVTIVTPTPIAIGNIPAGGSGNFSFQLNYPATTPVTRSSLTVTLTDDSGLTNTVTFNNLFR